MRKFYTLLTAMALTAVAANAEGSEGALGTAVVITPSEGLPAITGNIYTTYEFQWLEDNEPVEITLVADKEITVKIGEEEETFTPEVLASNPNFGIGDWSTKADDDAEDEDEGDETPAGTILSLNIWDWYYEIGYPGAGEVTITIPEGIVTDSKGNENEAQTITYTAYAMTWDVVCSIEDWTTYNPATVKEITWTFDDELELIKDHAPIIFTTFVNYEGTEKPFTGTVSVNGNVLTLGMGELADGDYSVIIPSAVVKVGTSNVNSQLSVRFQVFDGMNEAEILNGPGRYEIQGLLPTLQLTWDYQTVAPTTLGLTGTIIIYDGEEDEYGYPEAREIEIPADSFFLATMEKPSGETGTPELTTRADETGNTLLVDYQALIPADYAGQVELTIPAGIVASTEGGLINPELTLYFTIYPLMTQAPTVMVDEGVIDITWEGYNVGYPSEDLILVDPAGERTDLVTDYGYGWGDPGQVFVTNEYTTLEIDLTGLDLEDGEYYIYIPSGSLQISDDDTIYLCGEIEIQVTIEDGEVTDAASGIETIGSSIKAEVKGVYNLQGVKMSNDLNKLPRGLYIIDGKKVLVK